MSESMLCSKTHEYVIGEGGKYTLGLTDYAVEQLGDVVFVELQKLVLHLLKMKFLQRLNL